MKQIELTQNKFALVDDKNYEGLNQYKWFAVYKADVDSYYAVRNVKLVNGKSRPLYMHRAILTPKKGMTIDHINHDTLDNQETNLRLSNQSQQNANQRIKKNNISGFKGVSWKKNSGKWRADIKYNGKQTYLGLFADKLEAALAYNLAAEKLFGRFALVNKTN